MTRGRCYLARHLNPTDTSSRAYEECQNTEKWHVIEIAAMDHPNIAADLAGQPAPFPKAVRLAWLKGASKNGAAPVPAEDRRAGDFEFPPGSGKWHRPGALFESKVLGLWPTQGSTSVWSEAMWLGAQIPHPLDVFQPVEIGCDKARFGDDFTSIVVRQGDCVLWHETHNGWDNNQIAGCLKQLCQRFGKEKAKQVLCRVDDVQGGVIDLADGYNFQCVNSSTRAQEEENYPNKRSELWFATAERANAGRLDMSRLSSDSRRLLRGQVMAPTWKVDAQGRRVVEPKSDTKKRIGRSPDDADALNLAFYGGGGDWGEVREAFSDAPVFSVFDGW